MLIVLTTVPAGSEGAALARAIVGSKLAACVQIISKIRSFYVWEGELQDESEELLIIKTSGERYDELAAFIVQNHSYDVPEIVAIEADKVSETYLAWLTSQTQL